MKKSMKVAFGVGAAVVAAFSTYAMNFDASEYLIEEETSAFAERLLVETANDQELVNRYHIMKDDGGNDLATIFVNSVSHDEVNSEDCVEYQTYTHRKQLAWINEEHMPIRTCI